METKKQTRKTSSKTKELILEVAREIAAQKGVGQLTLEAVAEKAGISKGGLLYHFPGKKELIIALMDSYVCAFVSGTIPGSLKSLRAILKLWSWVLLIGIRNLTASQRPIVLGERPFLLSNLLILS